MSDAGPVQGPPKVARKVATPPPQPPPPKATLATQAPPVEMTVQGQPVDMPPVQAAPVMPVFRFEVDTQFMSQPAPIPWVIRGWIAQGSMGMLYGPSGGGKTFVALDMALHIANGMEWMGCKSEVGHVAYLAGEGHYGLRGRMKVWYQQHNLPGSNRCHISGTNLPLDSAEGRDAAIAGILTLPEKPSVVIVDTLHSFMMGDENSSMDAGRMIRTCLKIREATGATVILVHHTGNADDAQHRARGSSAWKAAMDTEICVKGESGSAIVEIEQRKQKDAALGQTVVARLERHEIDGWLNADGEQESTLMLASTDEKLPLPQDLTDAKREWEAMWHAAGQEHMGSQEGEGWLPSLTTEAARNWYKASASTSTSLANKNARGERGNIKKLLEARMIRRVAALPGTIVCDDDWVAEMRLNREAEAKHKSEARRAKLGGE